MYRLFDQEFRFRTHVNSDPGDHNFLLDNRTALYRMIRDQWFGGDEKQFSTDELTVESELKTSEALTVPLPLLNNDFHTLAQSLAKSLPGTVHRPENAEELKRWRESQRMELARVVRPVEGSATAEEVSKSTVGDLNVVHWKLQIGDDWTVPVVEVSKWRSEKISPGHLRRRTASDGRSCRTSGSGRISRFRLRSILFWRIVDQGTCLSVGA